MEKASMINAINTFTELSHPPDFGNPFSQEGKMAKSVKGTAKTTPNPNIPITGSSISPSDALIKSDATIGPVQDKEYQIGQPMCAYRIDSIRVFEDGYNNTKKGIYQCDG